MTNCSVYDFALATCFRHPLRNLVRNINWHEKCLKSEGCKPLFTPQADSQTFQLNYREARVPGSYWDQLVISDKPKMPTKHARLRALLPPIDDCLRVLHVASLNSQYFPAILIDSIKRYQDAICGLRLMIETLNQAQMEHLDHKFTAELENFTQFLCDCRDGLVLTDSDSGLHVRFPRNGPLCSEKELGKNITDNRIFEKIGILTNPETQQHVHKALMRYHSHLEDMCENPVLAGQSLCGRMLEDSLKKCERDLLENMRRHQAQIVAYQREIDHSQNLILVAYYEAGNAFGEKPSKHEEVFVDSLKERDRLQEELEIARVSIAVVRQVLGYCGLVI